MSTPKIGDLLKMAAAAPMPAAPTTLTDAEREYRVLDLGDVSRDDQVGTPVTADDIEAALNGLARDGFHVLMAVGEFVILSRVTGRVAHVPIEHTERRDGIAG